MKTIRKKELNKEDFQEKKAKDLMTATQKEQHKVKLKLEQRLHRQRKKERQTISTSAVTGHAFKFKAFEGMYEFPKCYLNVLENKRQL